MGMINKKNIILTLMIGMSSLAMAEKPEESGLRSILGGCAGGMPIADDGYDGSIGSMQCMNIEGPGGIVTDVSLNLAVEHTWAGDLTVKIVAPDNTVTTVMSRPGLDEAADIGEECCGDSSNLLSSSPVLFENGAAVSAEDLGLSLDGTDDVICQDDGVCTFAPSPGSGPGVNLSDFNGLESSGTWQVCVGDSVGFDEGALCPATVLNVTALVSTADASSVPVSGSLISFGSGSPTGNSAVIISNAASATADLTNIMCGFSGADNTNFTVDTAMPAGPIAPGGNLTVNLSASVADGVTATSTLTCTYDGDNSGSSYSWTASITGAARVIPSLSFYGMLALMGVVLLLSFKFRRKLN